VSRPRGRAAATRVELEPERAQNAVQVNLFFAAGAIAANVFRTGPSGTIAYVRGANPIDLQGHESPMILRDYEAPIGVTLTYRAVVFGPGDAQTETAPVTITIPSTGCTDTWLTDIAAPANSHLTVIERLDELGYEAASAAHYVLNRRTPIVTSDIARAPTFELALLTDTDLERRKTRAALGNGVPILLRTPPNQGIGNLYFMATGWKEQRIVNKAELQARRFVIAAIQVERPDPGLAGTVILASYSDVAATYATYADLLAGVDTYDDLLHDPASARAADLVPWPPDDV
jgi:hypothetical protein